jgi:hypothetical protein
VLTAANQPFESAAQVVVGALCFALIDSRAQWSQPLAAIPQAAIRREVWG